MLLKQVQPLTLASRSPRRLKLLRSIGIEPVVFTDDTVVEIAHGKNLAECAVSNAVLKVMAVAKRRSGWIIAADTMVGLGAQLLGKPADPLAAEAMLTSLSGRTHQVVTGYAFMLGGDATPRLVHWVLSEVTFRPLESTEIKAYIASGEPMDKAGAYGIQGKGLNFISKVRGSSSNVMGLPTYEVVMDLVRLKIAYFASDS